MRGEIGRKIVSWVLSYSEMEERRPCVLFHSGVTIVKTIIPCVYMCINRYNLTAFTMKKVAVYEDVCLPFLNIILHMHVLKCHITAM